ncbi:conserved Plasmodium protein, unknown function [Plasmodium malariae]|uniref:Transmembrane protein n=1 Tax=Plasmodium malariae TaxID=5858 RepID=A0A1D3TEM8_PLAMA|nr:conserved Plasmodium protein, unknown function [Plasmodium malariae]SCP03399.1 conserved Plasmodium protein, unknown function [Plasmodium malariae]
MDANILYDLYKSFCCYKSIQKINHFVKANKEKINPDELKIINENKFISHTVAILMALGIQASFFKLGKMKYFIFRPFLPNFFGIITSCSFLYIHNLYLSRNTISKLIQLNLKHFNNKGICSFVDEMYKREEPNDYLNLTKKVF